MAMMDMRIALLLLAALWPACADPSVGAAGGTTSNADSDGEASSIASSSNGTDPSATGPGDPSTGAETDGDPPPMAGEVVTSFVVEGTDTQMITFGQLFARGDVPSTLSVAVAESDESVVATQLDVHARHDDGSIRHASITFEATGGTDYLLVTLDPSAADEPRSIAALLKDVDGDIVRVDFAGGVQASVSARELLADESARAPGGFTVFEEGSAMLGVVLAADVDTHLRVTMHLRWYGGTQLWADVLVENGYGTLDGMGDRSYDVDIEVAGGESFAANIEHFNHAAWHRAFPDGPDAALYVRHDATYLIETGAFPMYDLSYAPGDGFLDGLRDTVEPMSPGDHTPNQDATGFQAALGILPQWDALYLTSGCDRRAYHWMLANADGGMAFGATWNDPTSGEPMRIDDHPGRSYADSQGSAPGWPDGAFASASPLMISGSSHTPSIGFTAYAITASAAQLRSLAHQAAYLMMWVASTNRRDGGATADWYRETLRGQGWTYRSVAQAAYLMPDEHPLRAYFEDAVDAVGAYDAELYVDPATSDAVNAIGAMYMAEGNAEYRVFFHDFFAQATAYVALDLGFSSVLPIARYAGGFVAGRLGQDGGFPAELAPAYVMVAGPGDTQFFGTFAELAQSNVPTGAQGLASGSEELAAWLAANVPEHSGLVGELVGDQSATGYYFANLQPAASYVERLELPCGAECWARVRASGRWPDYSEVPQFSIIPR